MEVNNSLIEILSILRNCLLISIFGPVGQKLEKSIYKFSSLNLLMLNETTLEMLFSVKFW